MLPPLPIPPGSWLAAANARLRQAKIEPRAREFKAFEEWAAAHGQAGQFGAAAPSQFGTPAWEATHAFFRDHTGAGRENAAPFLLTCFFYDEAFWPLHVGLVLGRRVVDPFLYLKEVPESVLHLLGQDAAGAGAIFRGC